MMNQNDACQAFERWLTFRGLASGTVSQYVYQFNRFANTLPPDTDFSQLEPNSAVDYIYSLKVERNLSASTINTVICSLRCFFDVILSQPISKRCLPNIKYTQNEPKVFTDSEISLLLDNSDIRMKAWICLGFDCGLRVSEAADLMVRDIDSKNMLLHIVCSKRNKSRYVRLSKYCLDILRTYWITYHPDKNGYLFPDKNNDPISSNYISTHFHKLLIRLDIRPDEYMRYHNLRDTYATNMRKAGCDIFDLRKALGHSSLKSTARYISFSTDDIAHMFSPSDVMDGIHHE